jgi:UDP-N-acetylglucosamine 2-epimerase (non-hydrolysing)
MHPRTLNNIQKFGMEPVLNDLNSLVITGPMDYFSFQHLIQHCKLVLTDSGGIQEETTYVQKPCLTLRPNTERPSTITIGSNTLLHFDQEEILGYVAAVYAQTYKKGQIPTLWDGRATERILSVLKNHLVY